MIALGPADPDYPARLRDLAKPPDPLWVDGDVDALRARCVAIVGTRRMTGYGERVARDIGRSCAAAGLVVVSGLAQGIDTAAHRGALEAGGRTVAVLGEGIDLFMAEVRGRRRPLVPGIRATGALVSEYAPAFIPKPWTFVRRNATIAALAEVVVLVEAPEGSGALITAGHAHRLGRPVFAVPGPLGSWASVGTNDLLASGVARTLTGAGDVLGLLGVAAASPLAREIDPVLRSLADGPLGIDELARRTRLSLSALSARVADLTLRGTIETTPDGRLRRA